MPASQKQLFLVCWRDRHSHHKTVVGSKVAAEKLATQVRAAHHSVHSVTVTKL